MTWDDITLESPSYNASNAGTLVRLPAARWARKLTEAAAEEVPTGNGDDPIKTTFGSYTERIVIQGNLTTEMAQSTAVWDATIVRGTSRSQLSCVEEWENLLDASIREWWDEDVSGSANWHNDGAPARVKGTMRLRLGDRIQTGTADSGTTTTLVDNELNQADDYWADAVVIMTSGANAGAFRTVTTSNLAATRLTFSAFSNVVAAGDTYMIVPTSTNPDALLPRYVYGYVTSIQYGDVHAAFRTADIRPYTIEFAYARVEN